MAKGAILVHRELREHWLWKKRPFSPGQAWIAMLFSANHKDKKIPFNGQLTTIKRGEFVRSERDLGTEFGWSKSAVHRFLVLLECDQMIVRKSDQKANHITICNYDKWQHFRTATGPILDQQWTSSGPVVDLNNKCRTNEDYENEEISKPQNGIPPYREIISYLNQKTNQSYRTSSKRTQTCIHARWRDGFNLEDFRYVIDVKADEWLGNPEMEKFLRPETLFGTKMENYRNQKMGKSHLSKAGMKTAMAAMRILEEDGHEEQETLP